MAVTPVRPSFYAGAGCGQVCQIMPPRVYNILNVPFVSDYTLSVNFERPQIGASKSFPDANNRLREYYYIKIHAKASILKHPFTFDIKPSNIYYGLFACKEFLIKDPAPRKYPIWFKNTNKEDFSAPY
jgi:hypothetical protein